MCKLLDDHRPASSKPDDGDAEVLEDSLPSLAEEPRLPVVALVEFAVLISWLRCADDAAGTDDLKLRQRLCRAAFAGEPDLTCC